MATELVVGVSGISASDNPGPGTGIARSIKEDVGLNAKVYGLAYDAMEPGIYMDWLIDKSFTVPYPSGGGESYLQRLKYIKQIYGLDCIIPNLDAELPLYIKYADQLADEGIRTFLPTMSQYQMRGKDRLPEIAREIGVACPETRVVTSDKMLSEAIEEIGLPVMVKGIFYEAFMAHTIQEAFGHYRKLAAKWGYPIVVQEVVSGEELNVVGVGDGEGNALGLVGIKKTSVTSLGKVWTAVTVTNEKMIEATQQFIGKYKWRGPLEVECRVDGDKVHLIEINPRFPAWVYFAAGVGVNLPSQLVRRAMDLEVPLLPDFETGKMFMRYTGELVMEMSQFEKVITRGETL